MLTVLKAMWPVIAVLVAVLIVWAVWFTSHGVFPTARHFVWDDNIWRTVVVFLLFMIWLKG